MRLWFYFGNRYFSRYFQGKHSHLLASVEDEADASAAKGLIEEVGNDEEEFEGE